MGGHQSTQWKAIENKNGQASPVRRLCWRGLKVRGTDLNFKQEGAYKWPPHLLWHLGRSQLFVSPTHAHAELPRWISSRTRFQMVSDVAEGLPDGYSYIYASMYCTYAWLGQFHWPWPHGDAATIVSGDFSRVTRPAGWTRAQLVALPVETADNGKEKGWEYNEYQWRTDTLFHLSFLY